MEVLQHTHTAADPDSHHRGRKKWTHYFWEFFMWLFTGFELPLASASGLYKSKLLIWL